MAGAFHGVGERDCAINVRISGPGVVKRALESVYDEDFETLCETIKKTAFKITCWPACRQRGCFTSRSPLWNNRSFTCPHTRCRDSVGNLPDHGPGACRSSRTTAALAILNDNVKKGGIMASSCVGGLSGAFIPVSEDHGMIEAVEAGALTLEKLEAMTCVCSVGLDMIAIPGDTSPDTISG